MGARTGELEKCLAAWAWQTGRIDKTPEEGDYFARKN